MVNIGLRSKQRKIMKKIIKNPIRRTEAIQLGGTTLANLEIRMKPFARRKIATKRKPSAVPKRHKKTICCASKGH